MKPYITGKGAAIDRILAMSLLDKSSKRLDMTTHCCITNRQTVAREVSLLRCTYPVNACFSAFLRSILR